MPDAMSRMGETRLRVECGLLVFAPVPGGTWERFTPDTYLRIEWDSSGTAQIDTVRPSFAFPLVLWALRATDLHPTTNAPWRTVFVIGPGLMGGAMGCLDSPALRLDLVLPQPRVAASDVKWEEVRFTEEQRRLAATQLEPFAIAPLIRHLETGEVTPPRSLWRHVVEVVDDPRITDTVARLRDSWDEDTRAWADRLLEARGRRFSERPTDS